MIHHEMRAGSWCVALAFILPVAPCYVSVSIAILHFKADTPTHELRFFPRLEPRSHCAQIPSILKSSRQAKHGAMRSDSESADGDATHAWQRHEKGMQPLRTCGSRYGPEKRVKEARALTSRLCRLALPRRQPTQGFVVRGCTKKNHAYPARHTQIYNSGPHIHMCTSKRSGEI